MAQGELKYFHFICRVIHGRIQRGEGFGPPLKNHKIGFTSNIDTDPLKITKLPRSFAGGPMTAHYKWHFDPLSIPSAPQKVVSVGPPDKTFWIRAYKYKCVYLCFDFFCIFYYIIGGPLTGYRYFRV